jgi:hypothetical protein
MSDYPRLVKVAAGVLLNVKRIEKVELINGVLYAHLINGSKQEVFSDFKSSFLHKFNYKIAVPEGQDSDELVHLSVSEMASKAVRSGGKL